MVRLLLVWAVASASCVCGKDVVTPVTQCGRECYSPGGPVNAPCRRGVLRCNDDGTSFCQDEVVPSAEVCDRLDNDCDGLIDENISNCCKSTGPEVCDGVDNDCNGDVDDISSVAVTFCYEGQQQSATHLPCRPGVNKCSFGQTFCSGQVLPEEEVCDGVDNDCDGQIDEDLSSIKPIDIVFVMDNSGSMTNAAQVIMTAVTGFATSYNNDPSIRWALVAAPPETPKTPDGQWMPVIGPTVITGFTDANTFSTFFAEQKATSGAGEEPTLDAMYGICINSFGLNWTPASKRVIVMLSDESPQSYNNPIIKISDVISACSGYTVLLFVEATNYNWQVLSFRLNATMRDIRSANLGSELSLLVTNALCRK